MKININLLKASFIVSGWGILIILLYFTYKDARYNITNTIKNRMNDAIDIDYENRFSGMPYSKSASDKKYLHGVTITSEAGTDTINFKDSISAPIVDKLCNQLMLSELNPLNPDDINELLKDQLKKDNIEYVKTGIIYYNKGKKTFSNNDSTSLKSAIITPIENIDIKNTLAIQAWANIKWYQVIVRSSIRKLWSVVTYSTVLIFVSLLFIMKSKKRKRPLNIGHIEFGSMTLDTENHKLYIDNRLCPITPADFKLLVLFINAPDHFLTKECIKNEFWASDINSDNKIHSHISTLKSSMKDYPEFRIINKTNKGYQLEIATPN